MYPIIEHKRTLIPGGTWTPRANGKFTGGDPKKSEYFIQGFAEIRENRGLLKLFCKDISLEKRKKKEKKAPPPEENEDEDEETKQEPHRETNEEHVKKLLSQIEEVTEKNMGQDAVAMKAPKFCLYLSKQRPKSRMPNIHKEGIHLPVKRSPNGNFAANEHSLGEFDVVLKDIPDVLQFGGLVVLKLPTDEPKTEEPQIIGILKFEHARHVKVHTMSALGLNKLADTMIKACGGLDATEKTKKAKTAREKLSALSSYRRRADEAWNSLDMEQDEEMEFGEFKNMLEDQEIILLDPQAYRAFLAVEVQGDGQLGISEYENFLMLYDIMGHNTSDLLIMDVYDYFKQIPDHKNDDLVKQKNEGLDYSAFLEALDMLEVVIDQEQDGEAEVKKAFMKVAKLKKPEQIETTWLTYKQFKDAWLILCDHSKELKKRNLIPQVGSFATGKNRERLARYQADKEDAYETNLRTINGIVDQIKSEHRKKTDEKKAEKSSFLDQLAHEADKFKAIRGQEKRLLIKKEQEEKSKKRIEEKLIRNKLLMQQSENKKAFDADLANKKAARRAADDKEIREKGWDNLDLSVSNLKLLPTKYYDNEDSRIQYSYCELLDLSTNKLEEFPAEFMDIIQTSVKALKLSRNRFRKLPTNIGRCKFLEVLDLDTNRLVEIPEGCCNFRHLQRIDISNNMIDSLPDNLGLCADIKRFVAHTNKLKYLPSTLGNCPYMEYIDVSHNYLSEIPEELENCTSLTHMNVSSNRIAHLPVNLGCCLGLTFLDVSCNELAFLPKSFGKLSKLEFCSLEYNHILLSAGVFDNAQSLQKLNFAHNSVRQLFPDFGSCVNLGMLDLSNNKLITVPPEIGLLTNLQELRLYRNEMVSLPLEIGSLMQLQKLELQYNEIEGNFPDTIGLVTSLRYLDISFNKINELPRAVIGLKELTFMNAERNRLHALPDTMTFLDKLSILNIRNNKFVRFPIEMSRMKALKDLDLANNQLNLLPRNICLMTNLDVLNLSRNGLKALPVEFTDVLESVFDVNLAENPWSDLPPKWGKIYKDKHATYGPRGYEVAEAIDFLYGMRVFYDTAEAIWEELGVYHYSNRLNFTDWINEIRKRIPKTWDDGLTEKAKWMYYYCKENGYFPRWYVLDEGTKRENIRRTDYSEKRRDMAINRSKQDVEDRKTREHLAYDVDIRRRVQRKQDALVEHALNDEIKSSMELLALHHCARERDNKANVRYAKREMEFNQKDKEEIERLKEILDADRLAREEERAGPSDAEIREREETLNAVTKKSNTSSSMASRKSSGNGSGEANNHRR